MQTMHHHAHHQNNYAPHPTTAHNNQKAASPHHGGHHHHRMPNPMQNQQMNFGNGGAMGPNFGMMGLPHQHHHASQQQPPQGAPFHHNANMGMKMQNGFMQNGGMAMATKLMQLQHAASLDTGRLQLAQQLAAQQHNGGNAFNNPTVGGDDVAPIQNANSVPSFAGLGLLDFLPDFMGAQDQQSRAGLPKNQSNSSLLTSPTKPLGGERAPSPFSSALQFSGNEDDELTESLNRLLRGTFSLGDTNDVLGRAASGARIDRESFAWEAQKDSNADATAALQSLAAAWSMPAWSTRIADEKPASVASTGSSESGSVTPEIDGLGARIEALETAEARRRQDLIQQQGSAIQFAYSEWAARLLQNIRVMYLHRHVLRLRNGAQVLALMRSERAARRGIVSLEQLVVRATFEESVDIMKERYTEACLARLYARGVYGPGELPNVPKKLMTAEELRAALVDVMVEDKTSRHSQIGGFITQARHMYSTNMEAIHTLLGKSEMAAHVALLRCFRPSVELVQFEAVDRAEFERRTGIMRARTFSEGAYMIKRFQARALVNDHSVLTKLSAVQIQQMSARGQVLTHERGGREELRRQMSDRHKVLKQREEANAQAEQLAREAASAAREEDSGMSASSLMDHFCAEHYRMRTQEEDERRLMMSRFRIGTHDIETIRGAAEAAKQPKSISTPRTRSSSKTPASPTQQQQRTAMRFLEPLEDQVLFVPDTDCMMDAFDVRPRTSTKHLGGAGMGVPTMPNMGFPGPLQGVRPVGMPGLGGRDNSLGRLNCWAPW